VLIEKALGAEHVLLASSGSHALEDWQKIMDRKSADIRSVGNTIWVANSNAARPEAVQSFCNRHQARYVIFVSRSRPTKSDSGTQRNQRARAYSEDQLSWSSLDSRLGEVTGDIKRSTTGLWLDALEQIATGSLSLECYVKHSDGQPLTRFWPSDSMYPVRRCREGDFPNGAYQILAAGRLASPFAVWLGA
jgi:hypothetical protein